MSTKSFKTPAGNVVADLQNAVEAKFKPNLVGMPVQAEADLSRFSPPPIRLKVDFTWTDPDMSLLRTEKPGAPRFPIVALGKFWEIWCVASAQNANAPVDYTIGTLLATVGAILGNVRWPDFEGVWEHPSVL